MLTIDLTTLGIGMEAIGMRAIHNGFFTRERPPFLPAWAWHLVSTVAGGRGRAS